MKRTGKMKHGIDKKWHEGLYAEVYQLAKDGFSDEQIAKKINITPKQMGIWRKNKKHFDETLKKARDPLNGHQEFRAYVYKRLPPDLKQLWEEINLWDGHEDASNKITRILISTTRRNQQHLFLYALVKYNFNKSRAMQCLCLPRQQLSQWCKEPEFTQLLEEINFHKKNFFESYLIKKVREGDTSAILFANRSFNKDIYGNSLQVEMNGKITGEVNHNHNHTATLDSLPLELRKQILQHLRTTREQEESKQSKELEFKQSQEVIDAEVVGEFSGDVSHEEPRQEEV